MGTLRPSLWLLPLLAGLAALVLLPRSQLGYALPVQIVAVASGSMEAAYRKGDMLVTRPPAHVEPGSVVVMRVPADYQHKYGLPPLLLHRVIEVDHERQSIRTKGDANPDPDPFSSSLRSVVGTPVFRMPYAGWAVLFLSSSFGILWIGIVVGLLVVMDVAEFVHCRWQPFKKQLGQVFGGAAAPESLVRVERELGEFKEAIGEYALHLKSHTAVLLNLDRTTVRLEQAVSSLGGQPAGRPPAGTGAESTAPAAGGIRRVRSARWVVEAVPPGVRLQLTHLALAVEVDPATSVYEKQGERLQLRAEGVYAIRSGTAMTVAFRAGAKNHMAVWVTLE